MQKRAMVYVQGETMKASRVLLIVVLFVTSLTFGVLYVYRYVYQKDLLPNTASVSRTTADAAAATDVTPQDRKSVV